MTPLQETYLYTALIVLLSLVVLFVLLRMLLRFRHELAQSHTRREILMARNKHFFPMQLNAYERMITYLERIKPGSLVYRNNAVTTTAQQLQYKMISDIREEFDHNLNVQLFMSAQAWTAVRAAQTESKEIVKIASQKIGQESSTQLLGSEIFKIEEQLGQTAAEKAIAILKSEMHNYLK